MIIVIFIIINIIIIISIYIIIFTVDIINIINSHFTMKSLLKKDECLKPQAPRVGLIDGEAVYNASDVCKVRTVLGWKKEKQPRSVKPGEDAFSKRKKRQPKASLGAAGAQEPPPQEELQPRPMIRHPHPCQSTRVAQRGHDLG